MTREVSRPIIQYEFPIPLPEGIRIYNLTDKNIQVNHWKRGEFYEVYIEEVREVRSLDSR